MNRFAKRKIDRIYTLFGTLSKLKSLGGYSGVLEILNFSCLDCAKFTHDMKKTQIFRLIPFLLNIVTIHINAKGDYFRNRLP